MLQLVFRVALAEVLLELVNIQLDLTSRTTEDEVNDFMEAITELLVLTEQTRDFLGGHLDALP